MRTARTYLAGIGSGSSLLAAAVAAFVAVGTVVTFEGLPGSSVEADAGSVVVQATGAPESAAAAAGSAIAGDGDAPTAAASAATDPGAAPAAEPTPVANDGEPDAPGVPAPAPGGETSNPAPPAQSPGGGGIRGIVDEIDRTVDGTTGAVLDLGQRTRDLTDALDGLVEDVTGCNCVLPDGINLPDLPNALDLSGVNNVLPGPGS